MSTRVSLSMDKDWSFHPGDVKEPLQMTHSLSLIHISEPTRRS